MAMGMKAITVVAGGQTVEVEPIAADMVAWERYARNTKIPLAMDAVDFPRITHIAYLAYAAGRRNGHWSQPFEAWLDTFESAEAEAEDDAGK